MKYNDLKKIKKLIFYLPGYSKSANHSGRFRPGIVYPICKTEISDQAKKELLHIEGKMG
jgi:hypothetical protein